MEQRDTDANGFRLLVDASGVVLQPTGERDSRCSKDGFVAVDTKVEKEHRTLNQEVALIRAFNEIRENKPSTMTPYQRELFGTLCESIFRKHGITPETYAQYFSHLGTRDQLHR